jgi:hypothetical protein
VFSYSFHIRYFNTKYLYFLYRLYTICLSFIEDCVSSKLKFLRHVDSKSTLISETQHVKYLIKMESERWRISSNRDICSDTILNHLLFQKLKPIEMNEFNHLIYLYIYIYIYIYIYREC